LFLKTIRVPFRAVSFICMTFSRRVSPDENQTCGYPPVIA
jgi:hypothetical protein